MEIALSTHLFLYQPFDEDLIRQIKAQGFSSLEIWGMRPHFDYYQLKRVTQLVDCLKKLEMRVVAVHAPFYAHVNQALSGQWLSLSDPNPIARKAALAEIIALLKVLPILDCDLLVVHPGGLKDEAEADLRQNLKESLQALLELCSEKGIRIALENINSRLGTPWEVLEMVEEIASSNLGICLDIGHANLNGDLFQIIKQIAGKIIHIHASDNDGQNDLHLIPFEGGIDWQKVSEMLQWVNYRGCFSWELRSKQVSEDMLSKIYVNSGKIFPFLGASP